MAELVLKGGRVIDPAEGVDAVRDVVVRDGRIAAVVPAYIGPAEAIDVTGKVVLPGMIDTHAHVYRYVTGRFGLDADLVGVRSGVTTVVDQGGPSCMTFPGFRKFIAEPARTRVLCFISTYLVGGLEGHLYPDLYGPGCVDVKATVKAARENADLVRGIKAHGEIGGASRWGMEVMKLACQIGREADLPVYVHLGQLWPTKDDLHMDADAVVAELIPLLREGDILAHPFTRHPGGFVSEDGQIHPAVAEALARGVRVDVGHGSHFSFAMAKRVIEAGIMPYTLGADLHGYNVQVPDATPATSADGQHPDPEMNPFAGAVGFSLCQAMTELLALGVPLVEVVKTVTSHPAAMLKRPDLGTLKPGSVADVSVLDVASGEFVLRDNSDEAVRARQMVTPVFALRAGMRHDCDASILPVPERAAA